jgi:hypothetical protein
LDEKRTPSSPLCVSPVTAAAGTEETGKVASAIVTPKDVRGEVELQGVGGTAATVEAARRPR